MKGFAVYTIGLAVIGVAFMLTFSGEAVYCFAGLIMWAAVWKSGRTKFGHRFWRAWHRVNFRITNIFDAR